MPKGYFEIGEKVIFTKGDKKLEGIVRSVEYSGEIGNLYLVEHFTGNKKTVEMIHGWDLKRLETD